VCRKGHYGANHCGETRDRHGNLNLKPDDFRNRTTSTHSSTHAQGLTRVLLFDFMPYLLTISWKTCFYSPPLSKPIYSGPGYLDNHMSSKLLIDSLADLSFMSLTSNQPVEGSIIGNSNNYFFPLDVLIFNGPIRSTSTLFEAIGLSASLYGRSPYFFLTFLPIWHPWQFFTAASTPFLRLGQARFFLRVPSTRVIPGCCRYQSNIIYFNCACACAALICFNQNKQNGSHNTPLKELGRDQFSPLQVLRPIIRIKYKSLIGLEMLPKLCIDLLSSPKTVYSRNLDSLCFVCPKNLLFESREASRLDLRVSPIFPHIFYLMLQSYISPLVDWYSHDICCCSKSICNPYVPTILG
jgi:hypothetical protein